jgi:hypothetical protein
MQRTIPGAFSFSAAPAAEVFNPGTKWPRHGRRWLGCLLRILLLGFCCQAAGQTDDWLPVTPQDLQWKDASGDSGVTAVQLYYLERIDDTNKSEFYYHRIKVLTEAGRKYANVEIPVYPETSVSDLQGRTIRPDGSIAGTVDRPYEKVLVRGRRIKILAQTFTLPDVTVGSIVEYKYRVQNKKLYRRRWVLEHDLFTVKQRFVYKFPEREAVSFVVSRSKALPVQAKGLIELEMNDVPRFDAEEQMPPVDEYKASVKFTYGHQMDSLNPIWGLRSRAWAAQVDEFIGRHKEVRNAAVEAIGNVTDSEEKLRRLYARAQQIQNLSYERHRSKDEQKKEQIKTNKHVADVLNHGYGDGWEIAVLFTAMAREAGFGASVVLVASRSERFFREADLTPGHYDASIVDVFLNGKDLYLDPGTRFCPFGMRRWTRTSTAAIKLLRFGGVFFQLPPANYEQAVALRTARLALAPDGALTGDINVRYEAGEALEHRLVALDTDEAGRRKEMEDELKQWLPSTAVVTLTDAQGWELADSPLLANFHVEIPAYATSAGKRLLAPVSLFQARQKNTFQKTERKYPVYYPYPFTEIDTVVIKLPDGISVENFPEAQSARPPFGQYSNSSRLVDGQIITSRSLTLKQFLYNTSLYPDLKAFFDKVRAGDEGQTVLRLTAAESPKPE